MGKYRSLGTKFDNVYRNDLNANFDDIDKDIKAETTRAKQREDNIQAQVNTLVVNGDSSPAAAQAAVDAKGVDKGNLKQRLDDDYNELSSRLAQKASQSEVNNIKENKADKVYTDHQLALKRNIIDKIPSSDLDTSSDANKIKQIHLSEEVKQMMAGNTPINVEVANGGVTEEKYATESASARIFADRSIPNIKLDLNAVDLTNINIPVVMAKRGKNLMDESKLKQGVYISSVDGIERVNSGFYATPFIPITPSASYVYNYDEQIAFYDKNKRFISGIDRGNGLYKSFVTPSTAFFMRTNVRQQNLGTVQLEKNSLPTRYEKATQPITIDELDKSTKNHDILIHLQNPFVPTRIKMIGSSSMAGVGGTGYSLSGEFMFTDHWNMDRYANVETAYCWANNFKKHVEQAYNKEFYIDSNHPDIKVLGAQSTYGLSSGSPTKLRWQFDNAIDDYPLMELDFYGDGIKIVYFKSGFSGIFSVYVDGLLKATIDTYNPSQQHGVEHVISGLSIGKHKLTIIGKNAKNTASSSNQVFIQGFKVQKHVTVKNWGISGATSEYMANNINRWVSENDDFVIIQNGSNDRSQEPDDATRALFKFCIDRIKDKGAKIYVASFAPASESNENNQIHKMDVINRRLREISVSTGSCFIDIYQEFLDYLYWTGIPFDDITSDGLHVNDNGYDIMLKKVTKDLGITINMSDI